MINVLNVPMHTLSMSCTLSEIDKRICKGVFTQHVVVNVAKIVNARTDDRLLKSISECDIINIDGMGVLWAANFLGHKVEERVAGVDLFYELNSLAEKKGYPVYFLGADVEIVKETTRKMRESYPLLEIAGYHHGYFWDDEKSVVDAIRASGAKLLFVAITSPKKEIFINSWKNELGVDFVMGVGGTFDVVAGKVKRAPVWMQQYGLEWLFRVLQEPRRMWKRYFVTNTRFAFLLLGAKIGLLK